MSSRCQLELSSFFFLSFYRYVKVDWCGLEQRNIHFLERDMYRAQKLSEVAEYTGNSGVAFELLYLTIMFEASPILGVCFVPLSGMQCTPDIYCV